MYRGVRERRCMGEVFGSIRGTTGRAIKFSDDQIMKLNQASILGSRKPKYSSTLHDGRHTSSSKHPPQITPSRPFSPLHPSKQPFKHQPTSPFPFPFPSPPPHPLSSRPTSHRDPDSQTRPHPHSHPPTSSRPPHPPYESSP